MDSIRRLRSSLFGPSAKRDQRRRASAPYTTSSPRKQQQMAKSASIASSLKNASTPDSSTRKNHSLFSKIISTPLQLMFGSETDEDTMQSVENHVSHEVLPTTDGTQPDKAPEEKMPSKKEPSKDTKSELLLNNEQSTSYHSPLPTSIQNGASFLPFSQSPFQFGYSTASHRFVDRSPSPKVSKETNEQLAKFFAARGDRPLTPDEAENVVKLMQQNVDTGSATSFKYGDSILSRSNSSTPQPKITSRQSIFRSVASTNAYNPAMSRNLSTPIARSRKRPLQYYGPGISSSPYRPVTSKMEIPKMSQQDLDMQDSELPHSKKIKSIDRRLDPSITAQTPSTNPPLSATARMLLDFDEEEDLPPSESLFMLPPIQSQFSMDKAATNVTVSHPPKTKAEQIAELKAEIAEKFPKSPQSIEATPKKNLITPTKDIKGPPAERKSLNKVSESTSLQNSKSVSSSSSWFVTPTTTSFSSGRTNTNQSGLLMKKDERKSMKSARKVNDTFIFPIPKLCDVFATPEFKNVKVGTAHLKIDFTKVNNMNSLITKVLIEEEKDLNEFIKDMPNESNSNTSKKQVMSWADSGYIAPKQTGWSCKICLVNNPNDANKCVSCGESR